MVIHDPLCICEICTCGRHQCPFDRDHRHQRQLDEGVIGTNAGGDEGQFYRKEFATVGEKAERTKAAQPKGELSLARAPFAQRHLPSVVSSANGGNARNTFITSAALRKRAQNSQIELGEGTEAGMRSTYREESERALAGDDKQRQRVIVRRAPNERSRNDALFGGATSNEPNEAATTVHRTEYVQKVGEKPQQASRQRPTTSDLWKRDGKFEGTSVSRDEYAKKDRGERAKPFRPRENASLIGQDASATFQRETSNLSDYGPKRGEMVTAIRPANSDWFKSDGTVDELETVHRTDYTHRRGGERFDRKVPPESGILKGEGVFSSETHQRTEFGPKKGERAEMQKQTESDLWKREGRTEGSTVSRSVYKGSQGERVEARRPRESDILRGQGQMEGESVARSEFGQKGRGDRYPASKHGTSEVWKREGKMGAEGTVNREEYSIEGKRGERHEPRGSRHSGELTKSALFDPDIDPTQHIPPLSIHKTEFVTRELAERPQGKVPMDEGSDLLRGDGTFLSETSKAVEYQPKKGERYEAKRHGSSEIWKSEGIMEGRSVNMHDYSIEGKRGDRHAMKQLEDSDIWKVEGQMARETTNRDDYVSKDGERAVQARPKESGILKGQGTFASETNQSAEFGLKKGERAVSSKPTDSDIFKGQGTIGELGTVSRTDYGPQKRGERYERRVPPESNILVPASGSHLENRTVSREEFGEKQAEPVHRHHPTPQIRVGSSRPVDYTTVSREDFAEKRGDHHIWKGHGNESSFALDELEMADWAKQYGSSTHSQEEFGQKELPERAQPVVRGTQLSISEPGGTFETDTMYAQHFRPLPDSYNEQQKPQRVRRPTTALKLDGERELTSGYRTDFQNKVMPCPAGELMESVRKDHAETENFEFHAVNKGHHLYKSKENVASMNQM